MAIAHYTLMNKNTPVLSFDYDLEVHAAVRITAIHQLEAAPLGMVDRHGDIAKSELNYWWHHRAIPSRFPTVIGLTTKMTRKAGPTSTSSTMNLAMTWDFLRWAKILPALLPMHRTMRR